MFKYILDIIIIVVLLSCNKEDRCPDKILIPYVIIPIKSIYYVGDTIEIKSVFSTRLNDVNGNTYNFTNTEWTNNFRFISSEVGNNKKLFTSKYISIFNIEENHLEHKFSDIDDSFYGTYNQIGDSLFYSAKGVLIKSGIIISGIGIGSGPPIEANNSCRSGWSFNPPFKVKMNGGVNYNFELQNDFLDKEGNAIKIANPQDFNENGQYFMKIE